MPVDLEQHPQPIATGRTWRDLPSSPPKTARPPRPGIAVVVERPPARRLTSRLAAVVVLALLAGLAFGLWSPWSGDGDAVASPSTAAPVGADDLPETIVPNTPDEFTPPNDQGAPDPFGLFDGAPFADRFPDIQSDVALIELGELPAGYRVMGSIVSQSGDDIRHQIRLLGPDGIVTARAERVGSDSPLTGGEPIDIAGVEGRVTTGSTTVIEWLVGDVLVTVQAPSEVGVDDLEAIAEAVEVVQ